jgi:hypothetical protein
MHVHFRLLRSFLISLSALLLIGCASTDAPSDMRLGFGPDEPEGNPHPATYGPDAFSFRKWQKIRNPSSSQFFYKRCSAIDGKGYYSKTSYDCDPP